MLVRDKGNVLYNRISARDYEECQDDILVASEIAGNIQDAFLTYQVGDNKADAAAVSLNLEHFDRWHFVYLESHPRHRQGPVSDATS